jgi:hypothetical protein
LAYNSSDDAAKTNAGGDAEAARQRPDVSAGDPPKVAPAEETSSASANPQSAACVRFTSCRWQQPAENGHAAYCTHREVKPYAGTTGFDPHAWCPDCRYYKLRRSPKKRVLADEYPY